MQKTEITWARLVPVEKQALRAIMKREQLNESEAIRFIIRTVAQMFDLWPIPICPDCNSPYVEKLNEVNLRCEACGYHFGEVAS